MPQRIAILCVTLLVLQPVSVLAGCCTGSPADAGTTPVAAPTPCHEPAPDPAADAGSPADTGILDGHCEGCPASLCGQGLNAMSAFPTVDDSVTPPDPWSAAPHPDPIAPHPDPLIRPPTLG